jgi:hypothetical protein
MGYNRVGSADAGQVCSPALPVHGGALDRSLLKNGDEFLGKLALLNHP